LKCRGPKNDGGSDRRARGSPAAAFPKAQRGAFGCRPVLHGTDIPVHEIEALTRGETIAEIIEDYQGLKVEQVEAAVDYSGVYPKTGRSLPTLIFKRMLRDLAEAGVRNAERDNVDRWRRARSVTI